MQTIETISQEITEEKAVFTVLEFATPEGQTSSPPMTIKHLYFKEAGQTKLKQII